MKSAPRTWEREGESQSASTPIASLWKEGREPEREHTNSESLEERQRANFSFVFVLCTDSGPIKTLLLATPDFLVLCPIRTLLHWCRNPGRGSRYAAMQPAQPTPLAELVKSLAGLHQMQHQALVDLKLEQEDQFRLLVQVQDEDPQILRSLLGREASPVTAPSIAHVQLMKMGPQDDPEAFVDLFEKTAEACGWARTQWSVRLIGGGTGGSTAAAGSEPPGLRRSQAGHPSTRRPIKLGSTKYL